MTPQPKFSKLLQFTISTSAAASAVGAAGFTLLGLGFTALGDGVWRDALTIASSVCMAWGADVGTWASISYSHYRQHKDAWEFAWIAISIIATVGSSLSAFVTLTGLDVPVMTRTLLLFFTSVFLAIDAYSNYRTHGLFMADYSAMIKSAIEEAETVLDYQRKSAISNAETRAQIKAASSGIDWQAQLDELQRSLDIALDERDAQAKRNRELTAQLEAQPSASAAQPTRTTTQPSAEETQVPETYRATYEYIAQHPQCTYAQIAQACGISTSTVRNHLRAIAHKVRVNEHTKPYTVEVI